ncbi:MAG: helix-turn-helix transcriptional regulator [Candidatus Aminicenantes bacterium]|nr:helix-turn-helix transcriptional regulator [Candidatus Aminicenantes bacterium]
MEKIILLSSKSETEELIKESFGQRLNLAVIYDFQEAGTDEPISLILIDCDYHCALDKCLKSFLFVYQKNSIPAAILKPANIQNISILPYFFINILTEGNPKNAGEDPLSLLKRSPYYVGPAESLVLPYNPLKKIIKAQKIMMESHLELRGIKYLAELVGCSPSWLSINFKKLAGLPLNQFWARERCCRALWQLVSTDKPVKTIALETGYQPLYFSQLFRKLFKRSPSETRNIASLLTHKKRNII